MTSIHCALPRLCMWGIKPVSTVGLSNLKYPSERTLSAPAGISRSEVAIFPNGILVQGTQVGYSVRVDQGRYHVMNHPDAAPRRWFGFDSLDVAIFDESGIRHQI